MPTSAIYPSSMHRCFASSKALKPPIGQRLHEARLCLVIAFAGFILLFALISVPVLAEEILTNQDVVKMVGASLGEEVVIAKVREAPQVDFHLSVDDLVSLRK